MTLLIWLKKKHWYAADLTARCGTDWFNANDNCGQVCSAKQSCPAGLECYRGLFIAACGNTYAPKCTKVTAATGTPKIGAIKVGFKQIQFRGTTTITTKNGITSIHIQPPNRGARMESTWASRNARICADVKTNSKPMNGTVMGFYAITSHELKGDNGPWWEVDFEFLGKYAETAWLNKFDAGVPDKWTGLYVKALRPHNLWNNYCIDWDIPNKCVRWYTNHRLIRQSVMPASWNTPLHAVFSHWVGKYPNTADWAGGDEIFSVATAQLKNIKYWIRD